MTAIEAESIEPQVRPDPDDLEVMDGGLFDNQVIFANVRNLGSKDSNAGPTISVVFVGGGTIYRGNVVLPSIPAGSDYLVAFDKTFMVPVTGKYRAMFSLTFDSNLTKHYFSERAEHNFSPLGDNPQNWPDLIDSPSRSAG